MRPHALAGAILVAGLGCARPEAQPQPASAPAAITGESAPAAAMPPPAPARHTPAPGPAGAGASAPAATTASPALLATGPLATGPLATGPAPAPASAPEADAAPAVAEHVDWGIVEGVVAYAGSAPLRVRELTNAIDPEVCGARVRSETIVTGPGGTIANVFVEVVAADDAPACARPAGEPVPRAEIVRCQHEPHVMVVPAGSAVEVVNADGILHELIAVPVRNPPLALRLPRYRRRIEVPAGALRRPEVVKVACDTHPFMAGWWIVTANGCATLTGPDGAFTIDRVPPGLWRVRAWHEDLGVLEEEVRVEAEAVATVELTFR